MREDLPEAQKAAGGSIAHDVSVPLSRIPEFIARADAAMRGGLSRHAPLLLRPLGDGNLHYNPAASRRLDLRALSRARRPHINRIVHDIVADLGGSISAEHGIGRLRLEENSSATRVRSSSS